MHLSPQQYKQIYILVSLVLLITCGFVARVDRHTPRPTRAEIWAEVQTVAPQYGLDPGFVYGIIFAESSFNPDAETDVARGLMQLTEGAWRTVSKASYRRAFDWRLNIQVGCAYLKHCKDRLEAKGIFSYPMLAAAYHYGPSMVTGAGFYLASMLPHSNRTYQKIFEGDYQPVAPPAGK